MRIHSASPPQSRGCLPRRPRANDETGSPTRLLRPEPAPLAGDRIRLRAGTQRGERIGDDPKARTELDRECG